MAQVTRLGLGGFARPVYQPFTPKPEVVLPEPEVVSPFIGGWLRRARKKKRDDEEKPESTLPEHEEPTPVVVVGPSTLIHDGRIIGRSEALQTSLDAAHAGLGKTINLPAKQRAAARRKRRLLHDDEWLLLN